MSFQNFFLKTCHSHGWWKWQAYFQYLVHQFASHFSSIEFEFNSSCMQCHWIFLFKWNFIYVKSTHLKIVSLSLIVCNNLEPKFDSSSKLWFLQFDSSFSFLLLGVNRNDMKFANHVGHCMSFFQIGNNCCRWNGHSPIHKNLNTKYSCLNDDDDLIFHPTIFTTNIWVNSNQFLCCIVCQPIIIS